MVILELQSNVSKETVQKLTYNLQGNNCKVKINSINYDNFSEKVTEKVTIVTCVNMSYTLEDIEL